MRGYLCISNKSKDEFFNVCFDSYWKNNLDISKVESTNKILEKCKINENEFYKNIKDQNIKDRLKDLTNIAFEKDVFGAPTFIVNNKIFWGQDRLDYALEEYNS